MSKLPYYYSGAQLARAIVAIREGREVDPFLRQAVAEMPRVKPECDNFVVTGFSDHLPKATRDRDE